MTRKSPPFRLVHDKDSIHAHKRLYATATPRLYTESARGRAANRNLDIYSMDDESVYGPEFYKMAFSEAIEGGWLTDYKVIILTLKSDQVSDALGTLLAAEQDSGLNLDDAVKLLGLLGRLGRSGGRAVRPQHHGRPAQSLAAGHHLHEYDQILQDGRGPLAESGRRSTGTY